MKKKGKKRKSTWGELCDHIFLLYAARAYMDICSPHFALDRAHVLGRLKSGFPIRCLCTQPSSMDLNQSIGKLSSTGVLAHFER